MPRSASLPLRKRLREKLSELNILQNSDVHFAVTRRSGVVMSTKNCCTCLARINNEDAPVLTMGAYGTPKLLCDDCAELVETANYGKDYDSIVEAMDRLTEKMSLSNVDDRVTVATVTEMLAASAERAQKIKEGTYDFALDEERENEGIDDIPEELQETEEDRLLDEKDAEANAKFDKILNWMWIGFGIAAAGLIIWKIIEAIFLK